MIKIWHMSGKKYFSFLESFYSCTFVNMHFFRHLVGKGKFACSKKVSKFEKLDNINIVCLIPGDPNLFFFIFKKCFIQKNSKLIWHTSYPYLYDKTYLLKYWVNIWLWFIDKFFDAVVTPVPKVLSDLKAKIRTSIKLIHHPVDLPNMQHLKYSSYHDDLVVGFLGEKTFSKGYDRFYDVGKNHPNFNFIIAGPGFIKNEKSTNNILNLEKLNRKEVCKFLEGIDILIVPSRKIDGWEELFGIVIIEALSFGILVIASNHIGPLYLKQFSSNLIIVNDSDKSWNELRITEKLFPIEKKQDLSSFFVDECLNQWKKLLSSL